MTAIVGYRRLSSTDQRLDRQNLDRQDLGAVDRLFEDQASGKDRDRPGLAACLACVREGDTLRCHSADRLARSLADLIALVEELTVRCAGWNSPRRAWSSTATPPTRTRSH
jgi:DNA invertase Pin-like site-specific DNA recombinase